MIPLHIVRVDFHSGSDAFRGQETESYLFVSVSLRRGWWQFIATTAEAPPIFMEETNTTPPIHSNQLFPLQSVAYLLRNSIYFLFYKLKFSEFANGFFHFVRINHEKLFHCWCIWHRGNIRSCQSFNRCI